MFTSRSLPAGEEVAANLRKDPRVKVCLTRPTYVVAGSAARCWDKRQETWLLDSVLSGTG